MCVLAAGCGGGDDSAATEPAKTSPARTLGSLIRAAHDGDERAIRRLLTRDSTVAPSELEEGLGTFYGHRPRTLYRGGDWAVAWVRGERRVEGMRERGAYAAALELVGGSWRVDLSGKVQIRILGPDPGERTGRVPQTAVEMTAPSALAESGLWMDGAVLDVKGGGTPRRGTIYGAPATPLAPGTHTAVAFARTAKAGTAVAWTFTVKPA